MCGWGLPAAKRVQGFLFTFVLLDQPIVLFLYTAASLLRDNNFVYESLLYS